MAAQIRFIITSSDGTCILGIGENSMVVVDRGDIKGTVLNTFSVDQYINRYGNKVTVTYLTPQLDENGDVILDERGVKQYDSHDVTLNARITILNGTERIVNNSDLQANDGIGKFKLTDAQYLDENTIISIEYGAETFTFQILKPIPKKTYIQCLLRRRSFGGDE